MPQIFDTFLAGGQLVLVEKVDPVLAVLLAAEKLLLS